MLPDQTAMMTLVLVVALFLAMRPYGLQFAFAGVTPDAIPQRRKRERKPWEDLLVFKKDSEAPTPDPAIGQAATNNIKLGREWLSFAKDQFKISNKRQKGLDKLTGKLADQQLADARKASARGDQMYQRYQRLFQPVEGRMVKDAMEYDSKEKLAKAAAEAKADVLSAAADADARSEREMAAMGIDPRSGRYAGVERTVDMNTALAAAGAENQARDKVKATGMALREGVANFGRGATATAAQQVGLGLTAGNSAAGNVVQANNSFRANGDIMTGGFQGGIGANSSGAGVLNQQYGNQLNAWGAKQQADAAMVGGIAGALGTGAGIWAGMSSKDYKEDKKPVDGALESLDSMPVEQWKYKDGIGDGGHHIGPYAEDFKEATGKGDGKTIVLQDAIGLTMKAVQELNEKVDDMAGAKKAKKKGAAK